jgi:hypothetical protein
MQHLKLRRREQTVRFKTKSRLTNKTYYDATLRIVARFLFTSLI